MNKTNSFPELKHNAGLGMVWQWNEAVSYIISLKASFFNRLSETCKYSELLWEIVPHYYQLKTRGMLFLESLEKSDYP